MYRLDFIIEGQHAGSKHYSDLQELKRSQVVRLCTPIGRAPEVAYVAYRRDTLIGFVVRV